METPHEYFKLAEQLRATGVGLDEMLRAIRAAGAGHIDLVRIIRRLDRVSNKEAMDILYRCGILTEPYTLTFVPPHDDPWPNLSAVSWLVDEVQVMLEDFDLVGLYEFLWLQHSRVPTASRSELINAAKQALEELLKSDENRLVWLRWPDPYPVDGPPIGELADDSWNDPTDDPYLAIARGEVRRP